MFGARARIAFYVGAGFTTAALAGALLGLAGSALSAQARGGIAAVAAALAIVVGLLDLVGLPVPLFQIDRETPYRWKEKGPVGWALRNGAALGLGAGTRLGFWLWYVIPVGALLCASPALGAAGYGAYGLTRTLAVAGMLSLYRRGAASPTAVLRFSTDARLIAAAQLLAVGIGMAILFRF